MNGKAFFDTNIYIYLYSDDEHEKQKTSKKIINTANECIISTQILNEINNVLIKKWKTHIEKIKMVQQEVRQINELVYISEKTIDMAIDFNEKYGFSYYDCLMLASAFENGCDVIYTEDMHDGQTIENTLKIVNPFK
ncbi:MAG: PIN domain-containing protein [Oscillospiraceae bacterium]|nr:PIN domain-containing protein [Oscillospiraceae bacterium]